MKRARQTVLHQFLADAAHLRPEQTAVIEPGVDHITYHDLDELSNKMRDRLWQMGVRPGNRVGIYLPKSIDAVAAIFGVLKTGAAYVPVDPFGPIERNVYILTNCAVTAVIMARQFAEQFEAQFNGSAPMPACFLLDGTGGGHPLWQALAQAHPADPAPEIPTVIPAKESLAYILYTSGSTGKPKGVMLSHQNAVSYVDWCSETFQPHESDRFSSHAPFHFDLSILDIYLPLKHRATLVLVNETTGKDPQKLAALLSKYHLTIWYSTPSILSFLAQFGHMALQTYPDLRIVLFAGEVFPIKHLRALKELWPKPDYYNLYGPTETNVCTWFKLPAVIPEEQCQPFPIGKTCSHVVTKVIDRQGRTVPTGEEGELVVAGDGVMQGYWHLPARTAQAFIEDESGRCWYKTGDIVVEEADGNYTFLGRRDRMVKKRGYRIELGEIEAGLYRHPAVKEAAVVSLSDELAEVRIKAFLSWEGEKRPSIIELKRFCTHNLPAYMVPDLFSFQKSLPKTSTDKIDYQRLKTL